MIIYLKDNFWLHLNFLFIAFVVLFTVIDFSFYLKLLFATSQYKFRGIYADKHKTTPTTVLSHITKLNSNSTTHP